jgi:hypothetical protein
MGTEDRGYMRDRRPAPDGRGGGRTSSGDDAPGPSTPLWARIVIVLLILSLVGGALVGAF